MQMNFVDLFLIESFSICFRHTVYSHSHFNETVLHKSNQNFDWPIFNELFTCQTQQKQCFPSIDGLEHTWHRILELREVENLMTLK